MGSEVPGERMRDMELFFCSVVRMFKGFSRFSSLLPSKFSCLELINIQRKQFGASPTITVDVFMCRLKNTFFVDEAKLEIEPRPSINAKLESDT